MIYRIGTYHMGIINDLKNILHTPLVTHYVGIVCFQSRSVCSRLIITDIHANTNSHLSHNAPMITHLEKSLGNLHGTFLFPRLMPLDTSYTPYPS